MRKSRFSESQIISILDQASRGVKTSDLCREHRHIVVVQRSEKIAESTGVTFGLGEAPPLAPADEADTLAKYFLGFHRIPGTLVVSNTPFFRLAGLDNRRIDAETENDINYTINGQELSRHGSILLVDEVGKIFHYSGITGAEEAKVKKKISAVLKRIQRSSSN